MVTFAAKMKLALVQIFLTVTNDLTYDQRMQRICTSLAKAGYRVTLVGRELPGSLPLDSKPFTQVRLKCKHKAGKLFYLEYNWKLYKFLQAEAIKTKISLSTMAVCAIDLDTIVPCFMVSKKNRLPRVYDAHELFTELTEVKRRPTVYKIWHWIERKYVPQFQNGYSVNQFIVHELKRRYGVNYAVVRNLPARTKELPAGALSTVNFDLPDSPFFLYQGAVNEGRSFETLIPAMKWVNSHLVIAGNGNFFSQAKTLAKENGVENKVIFLGYVKPADLKQLTPKAYAGITLFENTGLNQYYSLANRFFDYIIAGIPQLCVNYPEYAAIQQQYQMAMLINDLSPKSIATALNQMLDDKTLYQSLKNNCPTAAENLCWEKEENNLQAFWKKILPPQ